MKKSGFRIDPGRSATILLAAVVLLALSGATAIAAGIDPAAADALRRMSDHLGGLQQFSVDTRTNVEDLLDSGQRVDRLVTADLKLKRPDKLRAQRKGEPVDQIFYFDGRKLTLYDQVHRVYAVVDAPPAIEQMLGFAQSSLGLILPAADLLYHNAYPLLMEDVTDAIVVGKSVVGGVSCDHLLFSRPGVEFQVWVADHGAPLPYRYIVTDTGTPALLSVSIDMTNWSTSPILDAEFDFLPPTGAREIPFMRIESNTALGH